MHMQTTPDIGAHVQICEDTLGRIEVKILLYGFSVVQPLQMPTRFHVTDCMAFLGLYVCRREAEARIWSQSRREVFL